MHGVLNLAAALEPICLSVLHLVLVRIGGNIGDGAAHTLGQTNRGRQGRDPGRKEGQIIDLEMTTHSKITEIILHLYFDSLDLSGPLSSQQQLIFRCKKETPDAATLTLHGYY